MIQNNRQSDAIRVTQEMIDAGVIAFENSYESYPTSLLVKEIYNAMEFVKIQGKGASTSTHS